MIVTRNEKILVAGLVVGASVATTAVFVAGVATVLKRAIASKQVHLFDMNNQVGRDEEIDSLLPGESKRFKNCKPQDCIGADCNFCVCPSNQNKTKRRQQAE